MSWTKHTKQNTNGIGDYKLEKDDFFKPEEALEKWGELVVIKGAYINRKSKFGAHPVIFMDTPDGIKGLDLSPSYTEQWEMILADEDDRKTIESGNATGSLVKRYSDKYKRDFVAFNI